MIDERCGKPKSLDGASEGWTIVDYNKTESWSSSSMICRHGNLSKKHNYWIPSCFKAVIEDFHRISSCHGFDKKSVCKDGSDGDPDFHLIHTGLTPSPTFPPRGAEADMPGVLQYHVES